MIDDRDSTNIPPLEGDEYDAWLELAPTDDDELDEPEPWRCRDARLFKPAIGRRYVIHPLPTCLEQSAILTRRRPRMGLRFAVG